MKIYKITRKVYEYYRDNVKGNENVPMWLATRKITRNIMLAKEVKPRKRLDRLLGIKIWHYGNLHITTRWNTVIDIKNHRKGKHYGGWHKDMEKYEQLTKELGIED